MQVIDPPLEWLVSGCVAKGSSCCAGFSAGAFGPGNANALASDPCGNRAVQTNLHAAWPWRIIV